jgi:hypothetical protein
MKRHNRINGYVDYDPNGKMQFYDSDTFIEFRLCEAVDFEKQIFNLKLKIK